MNRLSIAANATDIAGCLSVLKSAETLLGVISSYRETPRIIESLASDLERLENLLNSIKHHFSESAQGCDLSDCQFRDVKYSRILLESCQKACKVLRNKFEVAARTLADRDASKFSQSKMPEASCCTGIQTNLRQYMSILTFRFMKILEQEEKGREHEREAILQNPLSGYAYPPPHSTWCAARRHLAGIPGPIEKQTVKEDTTVLHPVTKSQNDQPNPSKSALGIRQVKHWFCQPPAVLWVTGSPGIGKSVSPAPNFSSTSRDDPAQVSSQGVDSKSMELLDEAQSSRWAIEEKRQPRRSCSDSSRDLTNRSAKSPDEWTRLGTKIMVAMASLEASCILRNFGRTHNLVEPVKSTIWQRLCEDGFHPSISLTAAIGFISSTSMSVDHKIVDVGYAPGPWSPDFITHPDALTFVGAALLVTYLLTWYSELSKEDKHQYLFVVASVASLPALHLAFNIDLLASALTLLPLLALCGLIASDICHALGRTICCRRSSISDKLNQ